MITLIKKICLKIRTFLRLFTLYKPISEKKIYIGSTKKEIKIPKKIWLYWESKENNELVNFCIYTLQKSCPNYEINVLNKNNVENYLEIPSQVNMERLKPAIYADYLRLALLNKYGGIWMDASILIMQNLDWLIDNLEKETFVFYSDDCTINSNNPIIENWFIVSTPQNSFITDWFCEFEKCIFSEDPYTYYKEYEDCKEIIQKIPNTNYLMCYISAAIVLTSKKNEYSLACINSGNLGHFFNYRLFSDSFMVALSMLFLNKKFVYTPNIIKYTKDTRTHINYFLTKKLYSKNSILAEKLNHYYKR